MHGQNHIKFAGDDVWTLHCCRPVTKTHKLREAT